MKCTHKNYKVNLESTFKIITLKRKQAAKGVKDKEDVGFCFNLNVGYPEIYSVTVLKRNHSFKCCTNDVFHLKIKDTNRLLESIV